jgi:fermentation-respiration switch protein FrsA (DUF1100 family)
MSQRVTFKSAGVECAADLYRPAGIKRGRRRPGLVMGHGFSLVKECLRGQAEALCAAGFIVLAIDYRSFGASKGSPRGQLFPLNEAEDYRNAISYLQGYANVDPARIGIWGASFAGALVSYVAAVDRRVKATCAVVPVTDGHTWLKLLRSENDFDQLLRAVEADRKTRYAGGRGGRIAVAGPPGSLCAIPGDAEILGFFALLRRDFPTWRDTISLESIEKILEFSPWSFVQRIAPRPYLIISTAGHDIVHPAWTVAEMYERARQPKQLEFLPFDQTGLYSEPGLGRSNAVAAEFFRDALGPVD